MALGEPDQAISRVKNILNTLILLFGHLRIYGSGNRMVELTTARLQILLDGFFLREPHLQIGVARHGFLYKDEFVERSNQNYQRFASKLFMHGLATLTVTPGVGGGEIYTLLELIGRNPAETWNEGGLGQGLAIRQVRHIVVTELSDRVLKMNEIPGDGGSEDSSLWDRFALAQQSLLGSEIDGLSPEELAEHINLQLEGADDAARTRLLQTAAEFLVSLQHENIRIYRAQALAKLMKFVNRLTPDLRQRFLQNTFNLNLSADFAEGFYAALPDEMIVDALNDVALGNRYVPPLILTLLGKLAKERGLSEEVATPLPPDEAESVERRTRILFRPDAFEEFVPAVYRQVLLSVVNSDTLPADIEVRVEDLKKTLQMESIEQHLGSVLFEILKMSPDQEYLSGVRSGLEKLLHGHLENMDYPALYRLHQVCLETGDEELVAMFHSPEFMRGVVQSLSLASKIQFDQIHPLLLSVGDVLIGPLLDLLALENNRTVRHFCIETLKGFGRRVVPMILDRLSDQRWYVQRNLIYLLRELDASEALPQLRPHLRSPHPKVREEAFKTCLKLQDPEAEKVLLEELGARERERLLAAVAAARIARSHRVVEMLVALLDRNPLFGYDLELKRKVAQSLALIGDLRALPGLQRQLESHGILHHAERDALKIEIIKGLEYFPVEATRPLLRSLVAKESGEIRRIAQGLLDRGKGGVG